MPVNLTGIGDAFLYVNNATDPTNIFAFFVMLLIVVIALITVLLNGLMPAQAFAFSFGLGFLLAGLGMAWGFFAMELVLVMMALFILSALLSLVFK